MAWVRKTDKGRWKARYRAPDSSTRSKTFDRKVDAERWLREQVGRQDRGTWIDPQLGKITVAEMAERWTKTRTHLAQSTQDQDRHYLGSMVLPHFGRYPVSQLRPSEISAWLSLLDAAPATKAKAVQKLSAILNLAVADGSVAANPCDGLPRPTQKPLREGRALGDVELAAVVDAAERVDHRTAAMVLLMGRAGLRVGEVLALRREDVDLEEGRLHIRGSMSRREGVRPVKGRGDARIIPLTVDLGARLREHLGQKVASIDRWLFTAPRGGRLRYDNWRTRTWRRIVDEAGVGDVRPHDLRHTVATRLFVVDRWTVPQVQAYLGHVDPTVTLRVYTHVTSSELPTPSALEDIAPSTRPGGR